MKNEEKYGLTPFSFLTPFSLFLSFLLFHLSVRQTGDEKDQGLVPWH
jgi:hypothetical protein